MLVLIVDVRLQIPGGQIYLFQGKLEIGFLCKSGPLAVPHPLGALDTTCEPEDTTQGQPQRKCSGNEAKAQIGCQVLQSP